MEKIVRPLIKFSHVSPGGQSSFLGGGNKRVKLEIDKGKKE